MDMLKVYSTSLVLTFILMFCSEGGFAATVSGRVVLEGEPPVLPVVTMEADPVCQGYHPDGMPSQEVIIDSEGMLENVFVYVKEGLGDQTFESPEEPVVLAQDGCQYGPRVFGIQVNQPLEMVNGDDTLHNYRSVPKKNKPFNVALPQKGMKATKKFTHEEVMVKIVCDVHPWEISYAGILAHPFYSVTGEGGAFELKDLPPGEYVVESWHERYGVLSQTVNLASPEDSREITFSYRD